VPRSIPAYGRFYHADGSEHLCASPCCCTFWRWRFGTVPPLGSLRRCGIPTSPAPPVLFAILPCPTIFPPFSSPFFCVPRFAAGVCCRWKNDVSANVCAITLLTRRACLAYLPAPFHLYTVLCAARRSVSPFSLLPGWHFLFRIPFYTIPFRSSAFPSSAAGWDVDAVSAPSGLARTAERSAADGASALISPVWVFHILSGSRFAACSAAQIALWPRALRRHTPPLPLHIFWRARLVLRCLPVSRVFCLRSRGACRLRTAVGRRGRDLLSLLVARARLAALGTGTALLMLSVSRCAGHQTVGRSGAGCHAAHMKASLTYSSILAAGRRMNIALSRSDEQGSAACSFSCLAFCPNALCSPLSTVLLSGRRTRAWWCPWLTPEYVTATLLPLPPCLCAHHQNIPCATLCSLPPAAASFFCIGALLYCSLACCASSGTSLTFLLHLTCTPVFLFSMLCWCLAVLAFADLCALLAAAGSSHAFGISAAASPGAASLACRRCGAAGASVLLLSRRWWRGAEERAGRLSYRLLSCV